MASVDGELSRAELERRAYGRADTERERAAAEQALRRLAELDRPAPRPTPQQVAEAEQPESEPEVAVETPEPVESARRSLVPLVLGFIVIAAIAIVATLGILIARSDGFSAAGSSADQPTANGGNPAAAFKILLTPQTIADRDYPLHAYATAAGIQPASIHVALENAETGDTVWVARSDNDICMMWTSKEEQGLTAGGSQCMSPEEFARHGIRLSHNGSVWSWNGVTFTIGSK